MAFNGSTANVQPCAADLGIATQDMFIDTLSTLTSIAGDTPVIADADTGFGSTLNIARTVRMYERAGAAALHIEDQVMCD